MEQSHAVVEGPDVIRWALVGRVCLDDVRRFFDEEIAFSRGKPEIYVIVDLQNMQSIDADARNEAARAPMVDGKPLPIRGTIVVGGSFHLKLLARMINRASALLKHTPENRIAFTNTNDEAMKWIANERMAVAS